MTATRKETQRAIWYTDLCPAYEIDIPDNLEWSEDDKRTLPELTRQLEKIPADGKPYILFDSFSRGHATSSSWGIKSGQYGPGLFSWYVKIPNSNHPDLRRVYVVRKPNE